MARPAPPSSLVSDPSRRPVVIAARRTPVATTGRSLSRLDVDALAAPVLRALAADLGPDGPGVDEVLLGNCTGPGGNTARRAALAAGLGVSVPATTVDHQCGSGLEAVRLAAQAIASGSADVVLAGGVESASTAPGRSLRRSGGPDLAYRRAPFAPAGFADPEMGVAADVLAERAGITRARQDAYSARSHERALTAQDAGVFDAELVPVAGVMLDDRPRRGLDVARLARFPAAFRPGGTVTAGSSCGISDGAGAVLVVSEGVRAALGVPGLALTGWAVAGVDPALPGLGPAPAVRSALRRAGADLAAVDVLEITEAFAAQVLACTDELGLAALGADAGRVCPDGGAIALGHPWGASGALLVVRLFSRLVRRSLGTLGVATCAVGGGQGVAVVTERVG